MTKPNNDIPAGFAPVSSDLVGIWDYKESGPLHFIPEGVKVFSKAMRGGMKKDNYLVYGRLCSACTVYQDDEPVQASKGDTVGLFYRPGLRALKKLSGVEVFIRHSGEKDVGQIQPMQVFEVLAKQGMKGADLEVTDDYRKGDSWRGREYAPPVEGSDEDVPF